MLSLVGVATGLRGTKSRHDDDATDRLSSHYTVAVFIAFTITVSARVAFTNVITCWSDKHFTGAHVKYANAFCWVKNTYYLPFEDDIPAEGEPRDHIPYYQWVPFILVVQALGFYAPSVVWHGCNQRANVDSDTILAAAHSYNKSSDPEKRETYIKLMRNQMDRFLISNMSKLSKKEKMKLPLRERIRRRQFFTESNKS